MAGTYLQDFYNTIRPGCIASAEVVVPVVYDLVKPLKVIDVGCGEGWWANKFKDLGCEVLGVDGEYVASSPLGGDFVALNIDIAGSLSNLPKADMVVCLEVAEHLPESRAESFISELCSLAPTLLFSAAIPGQPGAGHIHCRLASYWRGLFSKHGFHVSGSIRDQFWEDDRIEPWYCVPEEAEIMTREGWKTLGELRGDEIVLTATKDNEAEWQPLTGLQVFNYSGDLLNIAGKWKTTPDHRWPYYKHGLKNTQFGAFRIRKATELAKNDRVIQVSDGYEPGCKSLLNERDAAILGWIVTDGSLKFRKNLPPYAVIYQSPKKYLSEILDLLGDEATSVKIDERPSSHGCATVYIKHTVMKRLAEAGFYGKDDLMEIVTRLDLSSARAMWEAMLLAEGYCHKRTVKNKKYSSRVFCQNDGPVLDVFQFLSFILGHKVNKGNLGKHSVGGTGNGGKSSRTTPVSRFTPESYQGKVWCPTTPNGTWIMRQNGAMCVTGNCQNFLLVTNTPELYPTYFPDETELDRVHPIIASWMV